MRIKFIGLTMPKYAGHDGQGKSLVLNAGDEATVDPAIGKVLIQRYSRDFVEVVKSEFAPEKNKALKKTGSFKSKKAK